MDRESGEGRGANLSREVGRVHEEKSSQRMFIISKKTLRIQIDRTVPIVPDLCFNAILNPR